MHSIRTKITVMAVSMIMIVMIFSAVFGVVALRNIGTQNANQLLLLLCEAGEKNLDSYFLNVEQSVEMVSAYVESDLDGLDDEKLQAHLDRVSKLFQNLTFNTNGILTYYYRIDPEVSRNVKGFWYVNDGTGFKEHEVTDITQYDTEDTSDLVWFTVPKATGQAVWLKPYYTETIEEKVISYNVPVYLDGKFVGVIGIEIDYIFMAELVDNITLYENGYAFINDAEGTIIYHPRIDVTTMSNPPAVPSGLLSSNTIIRYNFEGVEKLGAWLPLINGMHLNVCVPVNEISAVWQKWIIIILIVFAVMMVAFVIFILIFTGRITKPLRKLTEAAKQVDEGNYDAALEVKGEDEVATLTKTFNRLTAHLKTYISDLSDLAFADALTSVRNKGAFNIYVDKIQAEYLDSGENPEFAIVIFDCNNLKEVNDDYGHEKGDLYLQKAAETICESFEHSPVFRIGGDEFAVILMNRDFDERETLVWHFDQACKETQVSAENTWERVDVARGLAVYDPQEDDSVTSVVRRADRLMYENKWRQKGNLV